MSVQGDSLVGSTSFWLSRPVSARQLLAGKSVFLAGALIFPTLLVEVLFLLFSGVTAWDILRSIPETLFYSISAVAILMVLAAMTRNLLQMLAFGLVSVVVMPLFLLVAAWIFSPSPSHLFVIDPMARMTLQSSKWIGFFLCLMVTAVIMACVQYLTRRTKLNAILTLSALCSCILLAQLWKWDIVAAVRRPERTIVDPGRFAARIDQQSLRFYQKASTSLRDRRMVLHGTIVVENHLPDLIVVPIQVRSNVSFGSGLFGSGDFGYSERDVNEYEDRQLRAGGFDFGDSDLDDGRVEVLEEALGGVRLIANKYRLEPGYVPSFLEIPVEDYERRAATGGKLSAKVDFLIQKLEITPLAMEEGARYRRGSDRAEVHEVTIKGRHMVWISLKESSHRLLSDQLERRWYVMRNRSRGEALLGDEHSSNYFGGVRFILPTVSSNYLRLDFSLPSNDPSYGSEWFEGAELFRIDVTYLGSFSKTIRMENLVLKDIPGP